MLKVNVPAVYGDVVELLGFCNTGIGYQLFAVDVFENCIVIKTIFESLFWFLYIHGVQQQ